MDSEFLLDQKPQSESRLDPHVRSYETKRYSFIKTIGTICVAAILGAFGIYISMNLDELNEDNLEANGTKTSIKPQKIPFTDSPFCSDIPHSSRYDCWPQSDGVTQQKCENRGCCWRPFSGNSHRLGGVPFCFFPSGYEGYQVTSLQKSDTGMKVKLQLSQPTVWPGDVQQVALDVIYDTPTRLHFKIYDPNNARYEVPIKLSRAINPVTAVKTNYNLYIPSHGPFYITVTRKSSGHVLFSSQNVSPLVFADQFIQLGTQLSTKYLYGLGEHRAAFLVSTNWTKRAFWSRDQPPSPDSNLYGVHPFYLNIERDNNAHGVFLLNSNAMEVEVQPAPSLTYRTTGGVLDFYVFTGPTPDNVVQQYTELIGRPFMPPYWALGFHLCRWGYNGIDGMKAVINRMRDAKMPYDTQWNDIDYMYKHLDWTYDTSKYNGLPDVVADLHQHGQHYIMIIDPGISNAQSTGTYPPYDNGLMMNVFIKKPDGSGPIIGKVWPGYTAFPDFFHPNATIYWTQQAKSYHDAVPFDGIWIDMNEPSNFVDGSLHGCPENTLENPPFVPPVLLGRHLKSKTLCASAKQYISSHYNLHSLYGHSEAIATKSALDSIKGNKRSIVISRSTYPSTGVHSGHWLGDNNAQWIDTYYSIPGILNFNLFGIPLVGADICGFNGNTTTELCTRWMQLGAFYPFMRNHNTIYNMDQDPASFDQGTQKIMKDALNLRYTLLPYLYTLFYRSHVDGSPVIRPLFFQYPVSNNNVTYETDVQFMWGSALLITPTTSQNTYKGRGYLPKDRWFDWFNHSFIDSPGHYIMFDLPMEHINLQLRGGSIIPLQKPNVTTTMARGIVKVLAALPLSLRYMLEKEILQKENNTIAAVNEKDDQITFEEAADDAEFSEDISTPVMTCDQGDMPVAKDEITENTPVSTDGLVNVTVSQDAAWPKRGRGMNSLSGWGHVVGIRSKCLNFSTRIKNCATCCFYECTGHKIRQHDCRKNWCKSAKAMEPDIAVQLHREPFSNRIKYLAVVGDEDSSSVQQVRTYINPDLVKYSDIHHIKRGLRSKLDNLKKSHKALTPSVRDSFIKKISYEIKHNINQSADDMRAAMHICMETIENAVHGVNL